MFGGLFLLTLCLVPSTSSGIIVLKTTTSNRAWIDYKSYFNKDYNEVMETLRKEAFMESLKYVIVRNLAHELADEIYQAGLNAVSDFTHDEIHCHRNEMDDAVETLTKGIDEGESESEKGVDHVTTLREGIDEDESETDDIKCMCGNIKCKDDLDWVKKGRVLPAGEQLCGDCYAWAATFALSSAVAIRRGSAPPDLSVQESKDCSYGYNMNEGCAWGRPNDVYDGLANMIAKGNTFRTGDYAKYNSNYGNLTCNATAVKNVKKAVAKVTKSDDYTSFQTEANDDCKLRQELSKGPVATQMCQNLEVRHLKHNNSSDIYSKMTCTEKCQDEMNNKYIPANHAVMIVGYTKAAWLVQNSYGSKWGYKGRAYFKRGKLGSERICNLATEIYWPILSVK